MKTFLVRAGGYGGGIGDVVFTEKADGTGREYFLYNATGTTSALTDDDGVVTSTSCYTAWGIETATQGETENIRKFSTKERSELLGIDYFGFRYYDPGLGRFLTRDPAGYPDGPNNYLYCMNSPVNNIDPLGLKSEETSVEEVKKEAQEEKKRLPGWGEMFKKTFGGMFDFKKNIKQSTDMVVTPVKNEIVKSSERYQTQIEGGANPIEASASVANMAVGDFVGYTPIMEAIHGTDLRSGNTLSSYEQKYRVVAGGIQLSLLAAPAIAEIKAGGASIPKYGSSIGKGVAGKGGSTAQTQVQGVKDAVAPLKAATSSQKLVQVTSWADEGIMPDLSSGRWVMKGGASWSNYVRTGLPGGKIHMGDRPLKFWKWKYEKSHVPFTNHTSDWVPKENVKWPTGVDYWRGIFGQRRLK